MRHGVAALALVLALTSIAARAQSPADWLQRMQQAAHDQSYSGTFVYGARGQMESMRIFHRAADPKARPAVTESERLVSQSGAYRELVRRGGEVVCVGGGNLRGYERGVADGVLPASVDPARLIAAGRFYRARVAGSDRVAGQPAQVLEVVSVDAYRYSYRLWLDQRTGLLLKSVRHGVDGVPVELLMFTDIDIGRNPGDEDLAPSRGEPQSPLDTSPLKDSGSEPQWRIADIPPGFQRTMVERDSAEPDEEHQVYSDGLASVSVYISPMKGGATQPALASNQGAMSIYVRQIDNYRVYVVGDVPQLTAQRFAQGVTGKDG